MIKCIYNDHTVSWIKDTETIMQNQIIIEQIVKKYGPTYLLIMFFFKHKIQ